MIFKRKSAILFLLGTEINKSGCFAFKRKRKFIFLFSAKGSENAQGEFSEFPPGNPKTPHTPANVIFRTSGTSAPLSKGAKGIRQQAEKRDGNKCTSKDEEEIINKACRFAIKADGKECRPLFVNFNLTSLSRARKILQATPCKFFRRNSLTKRAHGEAIA